VDRIRPAMVRPEVFQDLDYLEVATTFAARTHSTILFSASLEGNLSVYLLLAHDGTQHHGEFSMS